MKNILRVVIATAFVALVISCNKQKSAINETKDADQAVIESRKDKVDAEKIAVDADAEAAKVKIDAENR